MKPRRLLEPHSIDMSTEPPHSPPTPMPCTIRSTTSRIGAPDADGRVARQQAHEHGRGAHEAAAWRSARPCGRCGRRSGRRWPPPPAGRRTRRTGCANDSRMPASADWPGRTPPGRPVRRRCRRGRSRTTRSSCRWCWRPPPGGAGWTGRRLRSGWASDPPRPDRTTGFVRLRASVTYHTRSASRVMRTHAMRKRACNRWRAGGVQVDMPEMVQNPPTRRVEVDEGRGAVAPGSDRRSRRRVRRGGAHARAGRLLGGAAPVARRRPMPKTSPRRHSCGPIGRCGTTTRPASVSCGCGHGC